MVSVERILQLLVYLSAIVGLLPVLAFLDGWVLAILVLAFIVGISGERQGRYLLGDRLATGLSIAFFSFFLMQVSLSNLVEPLIQMLCLLLAVRLATEKSPRHVLQLFLLATIVLASSSMLTLDIAYLFYLVLIVLLLTIGLVLLSFYAAEPQLRFNRRQWIMLLKVTVLLPVGSLLLMLVFFVVLPRTQLPLWNFLNPKPVASIGMADQVRPGSFAELAESGQIAFRAETDRLPDHDIYWRGIVLNRLEGQVWKRMPELAEEKLLADPASETRVTIYATPKADRYLVTLDTPRSVAGIKHDLAADGVVTGRWREAQKIRYQVRAQYAAHSRQLGPIDKYLQLPEKISQRLQAVAEQLVQGETYGEKIALLETFFRQQQLSYANTRLPRTDDPVDTFLFVSKRGYCEYFASSFALLLRLAGVPSRLVGGYLSGEYNHLGGYYLVGENAAHVWVEALDDEGLWQRIDPSRLAVNADLALFQQNRQALDSLRAFNDALLHYWSRVVLNYDLRQQFGTLRQVAVRVRDLRKIDLRFLPSLLWSGAIFGVFAVLFLYWNKSTRAGRLLRAYRKQVAKCCGLKSLPEKLGLFALARLANEPLCHEFSMIYGGAIYRDRDLSVAEYRQLRAIISRLRRQRIAIRVALSDALEDNGSSGC